MRDVMFKHVAAFQTIYFDGAEWQYDYACVESIDDFARCVDDNYIAEIVSASSKKISKDDIAYIVMYYPYKGNRNKPDIKKFFESLILPLHAGWSPRVNQVCFFYPNETMSAKYDEEVLNNV